MTNLYLDIETIPSQREGVREEIAANIKPPGNISKQETIDKWWEEKGEAAIEDAYRKTSLDGTSGQIFMIGCAFDDAAPTAFHCDSEAELLMTFFNGVVHDEETCFVGHNISGFDLRYLWQRAVINNVHVPVNLRHTERFNGLYMYDTMQAWAGFGNRISLDNLCKALGVKSPKSDITGATVWDAYQARRIDDLSTYCKGDIIATREVHKRLTFS